MADVLRADVAYVPRGPEFMFFGLAGLLLIAAIIALAVVAVVLIVRHLRKKDGQAGSPDGRPVPPKG